MLPFPSPWTLFTTQLPPPRLRPRASLEDLPAVTTDTDMEWTMEAMMKTDTKAITPAVQVESQENLVEATARASLARVASRADLDLPARLVSLEDIPATMEVMMDTPAVPVESRENLVEATAPESPESLVDMDLAPAVMMDPDAEAMTPVASQESLAAEDQALASPESLVDMGLAMGSSANCLPKSECNHREQV